MSSTSSAFSLTITQSSSTPYTLTVMTIVAAIFVPVVLLYTAWTYWVFRQRLTRDQFELPRTAAEEADRAHPQGELSRFALRLLAGTSARRGVIVSAACATLQSACVVIGAAALATAISGVFEHGDDLAREAAPVAVFGAALALRSLLVWLAEASGHVAAAGAVDDMRRDGNPAGIVTGRHAIGRADGGDDHAADQWR